MGDGFKAKEKLSSDAKVDGNLTELNSRSKESKRKPRTMRTWL